MDYEKKNKDAIKAIKQALRQLATNGIPVGNMIEAIKDIEEKYAEFEDERIKKWIRKELESKYVVDNIINNVMADKALAWLEKQGNKDILDDAVVDSNEDGLISDTIRQKPVEWSEEDEKMLEDIKYNFEFNKEKMSDALIAQYDRFFDKVKSLKPQPQQEWSKEDGKRLSDIIVFVSDYAMKEVNKEWVDFLKSLRPQNWTKEDKERYISCLQRLSTGNPEQSETINSKWFKEHVYPQTTWKPSEEQMNTLEYYMNTLVCNEHKEILFGLYSDLKKLMEE